jgi:1-acyl-sn-glycerol-3-phosphate acyltransferase
MNSDDHLPSEGLVVTDASSAADKLLAIIAGLVRETRLASSRGPSPALDSSLERDLGIDSLARVELLLRLERAFEVHLPDHLLGAAESPRDLLRAVLAGKGRGAQSRADTPIMQAAIGGDEAPHHAATWNEVLDWHVAAHPQRAHILLVDENDATETVTYAALRAEAESMAAGLANAGVGAGQAVAIMLPTGRDFFIAFLGILLAGAVPVPIYPPARLTQIGDHLRRQSAILANCGATMLITVPEARPLAWLLREDVPTLARMATVADLAQGGAKPAFPVPQAEDLAFLQYTSGSTGNPKGVMLTHANLLANIRAMRGAIGADSNDVFVSWLPLYHDMGLIGGWLGGLYCAYPLVVMSPVTFLNRPSRWLRAIHRYRGTLSAGPNFAYEVCASRVDDQDLEGLDLASWRLAFNGAEAVDPGTVARFTERFAEYGFRRNAMAPVYGLAECGLGLAFPPLGREPLVDRVDARELALAGRASPAATHDANALRFVACGHALPGHEIRIVDADGRELPERTEGRIEFRGPSATGGYFRNAEATRALMDGDWLDTGDLGYFADADLFITGRAKDIIIRGGQHVHPNELEAAVGDVAGVRRGCVAAFGVTDAQSGTEKVVILAETRLEEGEARERLRAEIARVALAQLGAPADDIVLAPPHTVLKTSSGKIRRAASRELYKHGLAQSGQRAAWEQIARFAATLARGKLQRAGHAGGRALYAAWLWLLLAVLSPAALAVSMWPHRVSRVALVRRLARALVFGSRLPLVMRGFEHLPQRGPAVIVANHSSYLDGIVLFALLPAGVRFVAKRELTDTPVLGRLLRAIGVQFVERFDAERGAEDTRALADLARSGETLVFFPEGTLTRAPGLMPFHMGAFVVSTAADATLVPVALRGTRSVLREGNLAPRRGVIQVLVGAPLQPEADDWRAAVGLRDLARAEILAHCGEPDLVRSPR